MSGATAKKKEKPKASIRPAERIKDIQWQLGEVDPFDLDQPYEPVKKPVKAPKSKKRADQEAKLFPLHNQLYKGDIIEVMSKWPDNHFDACITDPPYNIASDRKGLSWAFSSHVTIQDKWDRFTPDEYEQFTVNWLE